MTLFSEVLDKQECVMEVCLYLKVTFWCVVLCNFWVLYCAMFVSLNIQCCDLWNISHNKNLVGNKKFDNWHLYSSLVLSIKCFFQVEVVVACFLCIFHLPSMVISRVAQVMSRVQVVSFNFSCAFDWAWLLNALQIPHLRPAEYKRSRLSRNRRTVNRTYGGVLSGGVVRERYYCEYLMSICCSLSVKGDSRQIWWTSFVVAVL